MAAKKSSPKKLRPIGKLARELERQSKADAEKQPKRAPLGDLMGAIKRKASAEKAAKARWAKVKKDKT